MRQQGSLRSLARPRGAVWAHLRGRAFSGFAPFALFKREGRQAGKLTPEWPCGESRCERRETSDQRPSFPGVMRTGCSTGSTSAWAGQTPQWPDERRSYSGPACRGLGIRSFTGPRGKTWSTSDGQSHAWESKSPNAEVGEGDACKRPSVQWPSASPLLPLKMGRSGLHPSRLLKAPRKTQQGPCTADASAPIHTASAIFNCVLNVVENIPPCVGHTLVQSHVVWCCPLRSAVPHALTQGQS